jgi:phosphoribosylanthranilate isomerase
MLKASIETLRQAFFAAVAYASNAIKTLFAGSRLKQENLTIESLKTYSDLPAPYFTGKIFTEFDYTIDTDKVHEIWDKTVNVTKQVAHNVAVNTKQFLQTVEKNAEKLGAKAVQLFKSAVPAIGMLNEDINIEKVNETGEKMIQLNKNYTPEMNALYVNVNEKFVDALYNNSFELSKKIDVQVETAAMVITNTYNYEALSKYYAELINTKTTLENYIKSIEATIGKQDPAKAQELIDKVNYAIKLIDSGINDAKTGIEIAYQIEKQKLLAEKVFKNGIYIVASTGLLFYAYKIAKGYHPVYHLLTSIGLTVSLMIVLFAVKFIVENSFQIQSVIKGLKPAVNSVLPDDIVTALFIVSIGLVVGAMVYRIAKIDSKEARQVGIKTGKILSKF